MFLSTFSQSGLWNSMIFCVYIPAAQTLSGALSFSGNQAALTFAVHRFWFTQACFLTTFKVQVRGVKGRGRNLHRHTRVNTHMCNSMCSSKVTGLRQPRVSESHKVPPWQEVTLSTSCSVSWGPSDIRFLLSGRLACHRLDGQRGSS